MVRAMKAKATEFKLYAPTAKTVSISGSFNNWNIKKHPAKKDSRGNWITKIGLRPGRHEYKFFVDGSWINDPRCQNFVTNSFGTQNCILEVK